MITQQLLDYIREELKRGTSKEQIKNVLIASGWQAQDVEEAFSLISNSSSPSSSVPTPTKNISSLPSATAILGQALAIYKQRIGTFLGVMIIPVLIATVVTVWGIFSGIGLLVSFFSSKFAIVGIALVIGLIILLVIAAVIIQMWGQTALIYAIKDSQERIGVIESYRRGWHKTISYLWISFLVGLITLGGALFFVVPGIIFFIWFSLAGFVLIAEDLRGMDALLKSREYVRGKWFSVFWRFFFFGVIAAIPGIVFKFVNIPFSKEIVELFLTPLAMSYGFLVYSNLKAVKGEMAFAPTKGRKAVFIVIGILGILIILAILLSPVFLGLGSARERARDARREADISQIQAALEMYYTEHNSYPFSLNELSPKYLPSVPLDPLKNQPYQYQSNGKDYQVCTQLESTKTQKCVSPQ
jgi:competence protein ComGC